MTPVFRVIVAIGVVLLAMAASAMLLTDSLHDRTRSRVHVSPGGRYAVTLVSDEAFGQVETVLVVASPGTGQAHTIFDQPGDTPLRFLRWQDDTTAVLEAPPRSGQPARALLLICQPDRCALDP